MRSEIPSLVPLTLRKKYGGGGRIGEIADSVCNNRFIRYISTHLVNTDLPGRYISTHSVNTDLPRSVYIDSFGKYRFARYIPIRSIHRVVLCFRFDVVSSV